MSRTVARYDLDAARSVGAIATNQTEQFVAWVHTVAAILDLSEGYEGAEQVARICRNAVRHDMKLPIAGWQRLQSAYWISTDGYGKLIPARLANVAHY